MASAMERGSATTATMTPETTSLGSCRLSFSLSVCLMMLKSIGLILSRCNALLFHVVASARCARKSVPPGSTGRNASEYYAVGFDFALRHYTARLQEGNKSGKAGSVQRSRLVRFPCPFSIGIVLLTSVVKRSIASSESLIGLILAIGYLIDTAGSLYSNRENLKVARRDKSG